MEFDKWEKWYIEILDDFGFSREDDESSAKILNDLLNKEDKLELDKLKKLLISDKFIVFGAGPSLKKHIVENTDKFEDYVLIAADGSTTALLEEHIVPDIIATDLDGNLDDLLLANNNGAIMVIHAHGNNSYQIANFVPFFNKILGSTQSKPYGNIYNFGGFTDGDRAIFLAIALGASEILLAGMDFGDIVTKYSRPNIQGDVGPADEIKTKKLKYAEKLTNWVIENEDVKIINLK